VSGLSLLQEVLGLGVYMLKFIDKNKKVKFVLNDEDTQPRIVNDSGESKETQEEKDEEEEEDEEKKNASNKDD